MRQTVSRPRAVWLLRLPAALAFAALLALTFLVFSRPGASAPEAVVPAPQAAPVPEAAPVLLAAAPPAYVPEEAERPGEAPEDYDPGYDYGAPVPLSAPAEEGWFSDAAFLGDSLTEGLLLYTTLRAQGADCLAYRALNVLTVSTKKVIVRDGAKLTPVDALEGREYGKVYLSLGINELGWYDDDKYYAHYADLIDTVRALQPEADVYLQTLLPVTAEKSESGGYVTNDGIVRFNGLIAQLAAEKQVYLLDPYSVFAGEDGALDAAWSTDGVHLTKSRYALWLDYLSTHTVA